MDSTVGDRIGVSHLVRLVNTASPLSPRERNTGSLSGEVGWNPVKVHQQKEEKHMLGRGSSKVKGQGEELGTS